MKKLIAILLAALTLFALAANASAATATFSDISDETLARDVSVLQMMGVISGDGSGSFHPNDSLTRAQFCKMAVIAMGRGDEEVLYRNSTKFPDVRSTYWARGYINLLVSSENKIITGYGDGYFKPDTAVSYAQAVTMLMRMLGYKDADAGMMWPDGYLSLAAEINLTDGITFGASSDPITRANAAILFCNLLAANKKEGGQFVADLGTPYTNVVVMELDVTTEDNEKGGIRTSKGVYLSESGIVPARILGVRGTLVLDNRDKIVTFVPNQTEQRTITAASADASWIKDTNGTKYTIATGALAYTSESTTTYAQVFVDIAPGAKVTLFYSAAGKVDAVYVNTTKSDDAIVWASGSSSSLTVLTGGETGYTIVKNGVEAVFSDIRQYDVLTYDRTSRTLNVSDFRLTGYYENAKPSMTSPSEVTLMGHKFPVVPSAIESLSAFKVGQTITFLFTTDGQVAGATNSGVAGTTAVGIVQPGITGSKATVKLLNGMELEGNPNLDDAVAAQMSGELVKVSSYRPGYISLVKFSGSDVTGSLDLTKETLGTAALSPAIKVFERVGKSAVAQIKLEDIAQSMVYSSKILYARKDYAGRIDMLVLNDVTGDRYTYGFLEQDTVPAGELGGVTSYNNTISVINGDNKYGTAPIATGIPFMDGAAGGMVLNADGASVAGIVMLTEVKNVSRSAFTTVNDVTFVRINGMDILVSSDVQCYNSGGKSWFDTLNDARSFAETLTVYYDRTPAEGGKIRMVSVG